MNCTKCKNKIKKDEEIEVKFHFHYWNLCQNCYKKLLLWLIKNEE
jgi:hypothetical protein